jgi:hypothetical protein
MKFLRALRAPALTACAFLLFAAPASAASDPLSAVIDAQVAVKKSDTNAFNAAVDVDTLLNKGLDDSLAVLCERASTGTLPPMEPMLAMAVAGIASDCRPENPQLIVLRGLFQSEAKTFISTGVGGGYFAGQPNGTVSANSMHSRLLKGMSTARKDLVPGSVISQTADTAEVSATLQDGDAGAFPLRLKVDRKNASWRITEVLNARELIQEALSRRQ